MTIEKNVKLELFAIKQKFLRVTPHPKLILKEIKHLTRKGNLAVLDSEDFLSSALQQQVSKVPLTDFLNDAITNGLRLKHQISQCDTYDHLRTVLIELLKRQWELLLKLKSYVTEIPLGADKEIKMSDPIDSYELLKGIQKLNLDENEINHYLCRNINAFEGPTDSVTQIFLRANKIVNHG